MKRGRTPHFVRRGSPPKVKGRQEHGAFRKYVRGDFRSTCAYCLLEERWAAGPENFEIDHFRPQALFPALRMSFYDLYWSCHVCNQLKGVQWPTPQMRSVGVEFVDLCESTFDEHFAELKSGKWRGKTPAAKYMIDALRLNRVHLVDLRRLLRRWGLQ